MTYSCNPSFSTMSSIRTPSRTSSIHSGPDPFLDFDGAYSIYESELEPGYTSDESKDEHIDREAEGREDGAMYMWKHTSKRERVKKWLRKVLKCL